MTAPVLRSRKLIGKGSTMLRPDLEHWKGTPSVVFNICNFRFPLLTDKMGLLS